MLYELCILIPARFGQQQIANKNLCEVHGQSLVKRAISHANYLKNSKIRICLSTNKPESVLASVNQKSLEEFRRQISSLSREIISTHDFDIHIRSESLSLPTSLTLDTIRAVRKSYSVDEIYFKRWMILQPTSPFRSRSELDELLREIQSNIYADAYSLCSITSVGEKHPARMYVIRGEEMRHYLENSKDEFLRRQDLGELYVRDGGYYVTSDDLIEKGILLLEKSKFIVRIHPWNINIDYMEDLKFARSVDLVEVANDPNVGSPKPFR